MVRRLRAAGLSYAGARLYFRLLRMTIIHCTRGKDTVPVLNLTLHYEGLCRGLIVTSPSLNPDCTCSVISLDRGERRLMWGPKAYRDGS